MTSIHERLKTEGYRFGFFQALNLLERLYEDRPGIGHIGPYSQEVVKIVPNKDLSFPPGDVNEIEVDERAESELERWKLYENFIGIYGPNAAAPMYINEMIAQCPAEEDPLREFLDIFNHRVLSLFYRAWKKHNLAASVSSNGTDAFTKVLCSMVGWDFNTTGDNWRIEPYRLLRYGGYFASSSRQASALENLISDFFQLDAVDVVEFVPRRFTIPDSETNRLSNADDGGRLGESFVLGDTITDVSGQFKIRLRNLSMEQFLSFQPGEKLHEELVFLTKMYVKQQLSFCLELVLKPNQGGAMKLSSVDSVGGLGRSSWLGYPSEKETTVTFEIGYAM